MWIVANFLVLALCSLGNARDIPQYRNNALANNLSLPSNATVIRTDITDNFSCQQKSYGYYADVENDCQIFHVCLPIAYPNGKERTFKWSFICPEETVFNQEVYTCVRMEEMSIACTDSEQYYEFDAQLRRDNELKSNELSADNKRNKMKFVNMKKYIKPVATPIAQFDEASNETVVNSSNVITSEKGFPLILPNVVTQSDGTKDETQPLLPIFQRNKQFSAKFKMPASLNQSIAKFIEPQDGPKRFVFQADAV